MARYRKIDTVHGTTGAKVVVAYCVEYGEFRARLVTKSGQAYEPADAFDWDRESIMGTARAMLDHHEKAQR